MTIMAATREQKPTLIMLNRASPLDELEHEEEDMDEDQNHDASSSFCGFGGCFRLFRSTRTWRGDKNNYERKYLLQQQEGGRHKEMTWWRKKLKKAKESAEVLVGPNWKTFIRKIGGFCSSTKPKPKNRFSKKQKQRNTRFQYDLHSYALNFDDWSVSRDGDDDFGARFAALISNGHGSIGRPVHQTDVSDESDQLP